jgi:hypothetical protein
VDSTIHKRGKSIGEFEEARLFFSGKDQIYCLKSQNVTNRERIAIHVVAGVPSSVHDIKLFDENQDSLGSLIAHHPGEPRNILADKEYTREIDNPDIKLVTPKGRAMADSSSERR